MSMEADFAFSDQRLEFGKRVFMAKAAGFSVQKIVTNRPRHSWEHEDVITYHWRHPDLINTVPRGFETERQAWNQVWYLMQYEALKVQV